MNLYFGDALSTISTLLIFGVFGFIGITLSYHRKIALWGRRIGILAVWGFLACIFAAARDNYYLSVQASTDSSVMQGVFAIDSIQSILSSFGGAVMVVCVVCSLFIRKQKYRKSIFAILTVIITAKTLLIEVGRIFM